MNKFSFRFFYKNLFPFYNLKKGIVSEFDKNGNKIQLTENELIKNKIIRQENLKRLEKRGGILKYVINWLILMFLLTFLEGYGVQPTTFLTQLPFVIFGLFIFINIIVLTLFFILTKKSNA